MSSGGGGTIVNYGSFAGVVGPKKMAGRYFRPHHMAINDSGNTLTLTAARAYFVPFYADGLTAFAGAWCWNSGAGDTGKNIKQALYAEAAGGGPGALEKSFGAVTLTAASALRSLASGGSYTPAQGWHYLALESDTAPAMFTMAPFAIFTAVGAAPVNLLEAQLGILSPTSIGNALSNMNYGDYVAGTYANFPEANALTPTTPATIMPAMGLYT